MKNKDGHNVNTSRELLLLVLNFGSKFLPYSVISVENKINKVVNFFKNNRLSNWLKDVYVELFAPYPQYIFTDESEDKDIYIASYKIEFFKYGLMSMDLTTAENDIGSVAGALDVSRVFFLKKIILLRMINSQHSYRFRTRRLLEYPKK